MGKNIIVYIVIKSLIDSTTYVEDYSSQLTKKVSLAVARLFATLVRSDMYLAEP